MGRNQTIAALALLCLTTRCTSPVGTPVDAEAAAVDIRDGY